MLNSSTVGPGTGCTNGDLRLSGNFTGRLELCVNGVFGTVCDTNWDDNDAQVVCKQLGYESSG